MRVRFLSILLGLSLCGCAATQDYHYCLAQKYRAAEAWKVSYGRLGHGCSRDYQDGWKQGYFDISTGQCEEPPPVPPHKYWHAKYSSLEGRAAIDDWYSGWQDGATAAVQDGNPYFHQIPASPTGAQGTTAGHGGPPGFQSGGEHPDEMGPGMGPGYDPNMEKLPPAEPSHVPHPQVHVAPVSPKFASVALDMNDELLDESALTGGEEEATEEAEYEMEEAVEETADESEESLDYEISEPTTAGETDIDGYFSAEPAQESEAMEETEELPPVIDASDYK